MARGASAESMLALAEPLAQPDLAYIAPQAPGGKLVPLLVPGADHAERAASIAFTGNRWRPSDNALRAELQNTDRVNCWAFPKAGAWLWEYAARNARRYGGVIGLSAGLIGPEGTPRDYHGSLAGTPDVPRVQQYRRAYPV